MLKLRSLFSIFSTPLLFSDMVLSFGPICYIGKLTSNPIKSLFYKLNYFLHNFKIN